MKAQIVESPKSFQPVTIQITLESEAEYQALLGICRSDDDDLCQMAKESSRCPNSFTVDDITEVSCGILDALENLG